MSEMSLDPVNFIAGVTASTNSDWIPLDYRNSGIQYRSIFGQTGGESTDTITVELKINAGDYEVIATATTWVSATRFSALLQSPATAVRIKSAGSAKAVTVNGIV